MTRTGRSTPQDGERVVARALDIGVTLVDTADSYGGGAVESMLGRALKGRPDVTIVTKGGTNRTTDPARKRFDPPYLRARVESSLKRLGREAIDLYLLHHPTVSAVGVGEAAALMKILQTEGKIRHWGVAAGDMEVARAAIDKGAEVVELAYNLFNEVDLHRARGRGDGRRDGRASRAVDLAYGLLAGAWPKDREFPAGDHRGDALDEARARAARRAARRACASSCKGRGRTMRGAAVRFVLSNHLVSTRRARAAHRRAARAARTRDRRRARATCADAALARIPRARSRSVGIDP